MIRLEAITSSPFYWGEMSLDETMNVLEQEPSHSYLIRKWKNGSITIASLHAGLENYKRLIEIKVSDWSRCADCPKITKEKLEDFVQTYNATEVAPNEQVMFLKPVRRKNTLSLEEMTKILVKNRTVGSFDELKLPQLIKSELELHHHFEISWNTFQPFNQISWLSAFERRTFNDNCFTLKAKCNWTIRDIRQSQLLSEISCDSTTFASFVWTNSLMIASGINIAPLSQYHRSIVTNSYEVDYIDVVLELLNLEGIKSQ